MRGKLNAYFLAIFLLPPAVWSVMMYLSGTVSYSQILSMAAEPTVLGFLVLMVGITLFWLNRLVVPAALNEDERNLTKSQKTVFWFPVILLLLIGIHALAGVSLALSSLPTTTPLVWMVGMVFGIAEAFCLSLPFYVLAISQLERKMGGKAFKGNERHFPLAIRVGSGLISLIFSSLVSVGVLYVVWQVTLAQRYQIPAEEIAASFKSLLVFLLILMLAGIGFVAAVMSSISTSLGMLVRQLKKGVSSGADLTVRLPVVANDETGKTAHFFNLWMERLAQTVGQVKDSSVELADLSKSLAKAAEEAGNSSQQAAASVQEIASGAESQAHNLDDLNVQVQTVSEAARRLGLETNKIKEEASQAARVGAEGYATSQRAEECMKDLDKAVEAILLSVQEMGQAADAIGKATEVIGGIADETRLLALNAAIEAARAGEYGRGFAVVASEVRELADSSVQSTEEIERLVHAVQQKARAALDQVESSREIVQKSVEAVLATGRAFNRVSAGANATSQAAERVVEELETVIKSVQEETAKVGELAALSQETAASAEESAASVEELAASAQEVAALADKLAKLAESLRTGVSMFHV